MRRGFYAHCTVSLQLVNTTLLHWLTFGYVLGRKAIIVDALQLIVARNAARAHRQLQSRSQPLFADRRKETLAPGFWFAETGYQNLKGPNADYNYRIPLAN